MVPVGYFDTPIDNIGVSFNKNNVTKKWLKLNIEVHLSPKKQE